MKVVRQGNYSDEEKEGRRIKWINVLNKDTEKIYKKSRILTSSQKQIPSENSLEQTENFKRPKQSWKGLN